MATDERIPSSEGRDADGGCSRTALSAFMVGHYDELFHRLVRHLGCRDLAGDALHDAWLRLVGLQGFHELDNPGAYVYRVACNAAIDRLRVARPWLSMDGGGVVIDSVADHAPGPELIAEARSDVMAVDRAMQRLPHRHRSILVALRVHEFTREEVAARHGLSLRRVDTTLRQALAQIALGMSPLQDRTG
ncbi:RNA polymerase sigma factor [Variovorax boronicumulans]